MTKDELKIAKLSTPSVSTENVDTEGLTEVVEAFNSMTEVFNDGMKALFKN